MSNFILDQSISLKLNFVFRTRYGAYKGKLGRGDSYIISDIQAPVRTILGLIHLAPAELV